MMTLHATHRIQDRFQAHADAETLSKINTAADKNTLPGKVYFVAKEFEKNIFLTDDNGHYTCGDLMTAVIKGTQVVTVILVKSTRKDYFSDGTLIWN